MFRGLSAFPLTPLDEQRIDEQAFAGLIARLVTAGVDSITALGSIGVYTYLTRRERARIAQLTVDHADDVPVLVGIGALRTKDVLELAEDAQTAGAAGVLLAPVAYHSLTADEVYGLFETVTGELSVPLVVYDAPGTTGFAFTEDLYGAVGRLTGVASVKIPGADPDPAAAAQRISRLREVLPEHVTIGVSGDAYGATGLNAGGDVWYSALGGTLPAPILEITRAALSGDTARAVELDTRLQPLWDLISAHGSLRVITAIAEHLGLVQRSCLPLPLRGLGDTERAHVAQVIDELGIQAQP